MSLSQEQVLVLLNEERTKGEWVAPEEDLVPLTTLLIKMTNSGAPESQIRTLIESIGHAARGNMPIVQYDWVGPYLSPELPPAWVRVQFEENVGGVWKNTEKPQIVIVSGMLLEEKRWIHVSTSVPERIVSWEEMCEVKSLFLGKELQAIQVHPPASKYVNFATNALHLWACLDGDGLPDFTRGSPLI